MYTVAGQMDNDPCFNMENQPNALFVNMGDGSFSDVSIASGADDPGTGRGVAHGDFNGDDLLDLFVVNMGIRDGEPGTSRLFINASENGNNWLRIVPRGTGSNSFGIGGKGGSYRRQRKANQGNGSQPVPHVQLSSPRFTSAWGDAEIVDAVEIRWPSGKTQRLENVPVNQELTIVEPAG